MTGHMITQTGLSVLPRGSTEHGRCFIVGTQQACKQESTCHYWDMSGEERVRLTLTHCMTCTQLTCKQAYPCRHVAVLEPGTCENRHPTPPCLGTGTQKVREQGCHDTMWRHLNMSHRACPHQNVVALRHGGHGSRYARVTMWDITDAQSSP